MISITTWVLMLTLLALCLLALSPRAAARLGERGKAWASKREQGLPGRVYWPLFALALVLGVGVRVWRFPELPLGLNQDGAMLGIESLSLLRTGADQYHTPWPLHFEAWQYGQMSVFYSYLAIPFIAVLGLTRLSLRMPILVISLIALPVMWDFARRMAGRGYALITLFLVSINPWQIVQSRWALDASMMPHMLLFACYFLLLGIERKPWLALSMVFFGLTMYTYGIALYTVPVLLVLMCVALLRMGKLTLWQALLCAGLYLLVSGPFLWIMAINTFGWQTVTLGPFTLQRFPSSERSADILLFSPEPYVQLAENLKFFLASTFLQSSGESFLAVRGARTLYPFSLPVIWGGTLLLWFTRRQATRDLRQGIQTGKAVLPAQDGFWNGATVTGMWLLSAVICGLLTNETNINRAAATYYPLLLCLCYGLYLLIRRLPRSLPVIALVYALGFGMFVQGYFFDAAYIQQVGTSFRAGMYDSLRFARTLDTDRYFLTTTGPGRRLMELDVMVVFQIDANQRDDLAEVVDSEGEEAGYYSSRFVYVDFAEFEPDPEACAVYVVYRREREQFDPEDYLSWDFDDFSVMVPRAWADEEEE